MCVSSESLFLAKHYYHLNPEGKQILILWLNDLLVCCELWVALVLVNEKKENKNRSEKKNILKDFQLHIDFLKPDNNW